MRLSVSGICTRKRTRACGRCSPETFVKDGPFETSLYRRARRTEEDWLNGDCEAASLGSELAAAHVETAAQFIDAVVAIVDVEQR